MKQNIEWEVLNFNATREVTIFGCCPEPYPGKLTTTLVLVLVLMYVIAIMNGKHCIHSDPQLQKKFTIFTLKRYFK